MRIGNNSPANIALLHKNSSVKKLGKNMEALSSGFKVNRAADDAAGLCISEKMRAQIRGLNQASRNAQDGISLVQTAEGAMDEIHTMLRRMRELSVQSATGSYTDDDRAALGREVGGLKSEINRIAETTHFNGIYMLTKDSAVSSVDAATEKEQLRRRSSCWAGHPRVKMR